MSQKNQVKNLTMTATAKAKVMIPPRHQTLMMKLRSCHMGKPVCFLSVLIISTLILLTLKMSKDLKHQTTRSSTT
ncbi:hypothetical protein BHM03_00023092 [Ensete ventricosum]|nr:hypothetical protein BHM03_00023092 [Ensete ventricosum]